MENRRAYWWADRGPAPSNGDISEVEGRVLEYSRPLPDGTNRVIRIIFNDVDDSFLVLHPDFPGRYVTVEERSINDQWELESNVDEGEGLYFDIINDDNDEQAPVEAAIQVPIQVQQDAPEFSPVDADHPTESLQPKRIKREALKNMKDHGIDSRQKKGGYLRARCGTSRSRNTPHTIKESLDTPETLERGC
ncbi:hypothetical protein EG329_002954 [Mollisiaceae sp. DMI_Dod_QoI]|nr:hypothetical protein EG329_002954 [Helotiales sp. DMI_Dod_QoI]